MTGTLYGDEDQITRRVDVGDNPQYRGEPTDGRQVTANQLLLNAACTIMLWIFYVYNIFEELLRW